MTERILVAIPTNGLRPDTLARTLEMWEQRTPVPVEFHVTTVGMSWCDGLNDAFNAHPDADIFVAASDDMYPEDDGWLDVVTSALAAGESPVPKMFDPRGTFYGGSRAKVVDGTQVSMTNFPVLKREWLEAVFPLPENLHYYGDNEIADRLHAIGVPTVYREGFVIRHEFDARGRGAGMGSEEKRMAHDAEVYHRDKKIPYRVGELPLLPVAVAYAHPGTVRAEFADSMFALLSHYRVKSRICMQSGPRIATTRNKLVRSFLDDTTAEWLWMVDSDMTFDPDIIGRLIACEQPVVGGLCFARDKVTSYPTIYENDGKGFITRMYDYPRDELIEVDATGAACLLIHRSALEKIGVANKEPYRWFADTSFEGREIGEDITFCLRCWALDIPVHVHTGIRVGHIKDFVIDESTYQLGGTDVER